MMKFFRKHRNTLMIIIAVLAIPFIFYFNKSDFTAQGENDLGQFYDRKVSAVEARRLARLLPLAANLGMTDFVQDLSGGARDENERTIQFIFNLLILRREADRLGIDATPAECANFVRNLQIFHGPSGAFDLGKYTEFSQNFLSPNGFTEAQLEELARDEMTLRRIKELVATGVAVPESETKENYERAYGLMNASVIRLKNADFAKDVKITDEEIKNYFDTRKNELKTDEKRKVDFVSFVLTPEQKKLPDKERIEALQKLVNQAADFSQALSEKGATFQQAAEKFKLPVQTTEEFVANKPDPKLPNSQLSSTAFQLTQEEPNSEPVQVPDGYYILHLAGVTPSRPLTMEEARPKIVDSIKAAKARMAMGDKASKAVHELREGLKAGEPLSFTAEKVNVKAEKVPPFTLMEEEQPPPIAEADKNKPPESDQNKLAEADKTKPPEADQKKVAEADKNKSAEPDQKKVAEADKNKPAEPDQKKVAEADQNKLAEPDQKKVTEADKNKPPESDQKKMAEADKVKPKEVASEKPRDMIAIKNAAVSLQPGDVSEFFPWEDGGIIVVLEKRDPPDESKFGAKKKELAERIDANKKEIVFYEWLKSKQVEAGILKEKPQQPQAAPATAPG